MAMLNNQRVRELSGGEGQLLKNNMLNILKRFEQESKVLKYRTVNWSSDTELSCLASDFGFTASILSSWVSNHQKLFGTPWYTSQIKHETPNRNRPFF